MTGRGPELLGPVIAEAIAAYGRADARTQQSERGILGPSDLGFCRMKAALMTKGVPQSDSRPILAAQMGTAWHAYATAALREAFPDWTVESRRVTATFPCGAQVTGTPDVVTTTDWNAVVDHKTCDGTAGYRSMGVRQAHRYQRHTYALAAIQAGLLDESKPVIVGNLFWDRRGKDEPLWLWEEYDPTLTDEINSWITDVIYAVENDVEAERDVPAPVCERICEHYTTCRGGLPVLGDNEPITDPLLVKMVNMYVGARDAKAEATEQMRVAREALFGVNGFTDTHQVRFTDTVDEHTGEITTRLDIRRARGQRNRTAE